MRSAVAGAPASGQNARMSVPLPLSVLLSFAALACASDSKDPGTSDVTQQTGNAQAPHVDGSVLGLPSGVRGAGGTAGDAGPVGIDGSTAPMPGDSSGDA